MRTAHLSNADYRKMNGISVASNDIHEDLNQNYFSNSENLTENQPH